MSKLVPFLPRVEYEALGFGVSFGEMLERGDWARMDALASLREPFREAYGYVLATDEVMRVLAQFLAPLGRVLDAGCGSGYLAHELARRDVDVLAVDLFDPLVPSEAGTTRFPIRQRYRLDAQGSAVDYLGHDVGAVLLCWPPLKRPMAHELARRMRPGQVLVYEGEPEGGCTADDAFFACMRHENLWEPLTEVTEALNQDHVTWSALDDAWQVWRRR